MRLKRIKLAGFKSFVEPTTIPFPGSMTAVVGPNGCGKSNVIDAVRWVLGESSAKNLRGDAMTDVIFNGSSSRKPVGQCSVELIFENASDRLNGEYAKYAELSVKRLVTRDAQSNYFLNGSKCRRRDITDLFLGTGLGPRSYAIIEQGMISRLIESKPQELRVFIEEAAGISKYKERRKETETRIRHTTENLERLFDVRNELGQQLDKLERQASTAKRYTELKAKERTLKSELAMVRYLAFQQKIDSLQESLSQIDKEYEGSKSKLEGDEAGIEKYRAQQIDIKLQLDHVQDNLLDLTTKITRIEEAKQFKNQRLEQLTAQISLLSDKKSQCSQAIEENREQFEIVDNSLVQLTPETEILEEQYHGAVERRDDAEEIFQGFNQNRRSLDEAYHGKKRQAQTVRSQIESTKAMQGRTQLRIKELTDELRESDSSLLQDEKNLLLAQNQTLEEQQQQAAINNENSVSHLKQITTKHYDAQQALNKLVDVQRRISAKLEALQALQQGIKQESSLQPLWKTLEVEVGFEHLVEIVLSHYAEPLVVDTSFDKINLTADDIPKGKRVMLSHSMVAEKPSGTLAEKLIGPNVPELFTRIYLVASLEQGQEKLALLKPDESILTQQGVWLSNTWCRWQTSEHASGALQRQADIKALDEQLTSNNKVNVEAESVLANVAIEKDKATTLFDDSEQVLKLIENQAVEVKQKLQLIAIQLKQGEERQSKLKHDIEQQHIVLEQEQEQQERLSEQVELLDEEIFELEANQFSADDKQQLLQQNVTDTRQNCELITRKKHELSLTYQQQYSKQQSLKSDGLRLAQQYTDYQEQLNTLQGESLTIGGNDSDTGEQLNVWLNEKQINEENKMQLQQRLSEVDDCLRNAQSSQQTVRSAIEEKQKIRESLLLESEGMKARANIILEQLQETGKNIKDTLNQMPSNATEEEWASQLEHTQNAIKRLGAVNLAAVDEYKIQGERKAHLDAQDTDLTTALDTLQSAIRKIDKETKTRFSQTFEQVNTDLQALFPKVFGGGSAYLALTDDDLLETGVTIMARPPGKKNSTIHLLSGGEKALTALSLVFAIFRLNPAPFCLLDEVDAPLDDANVGRFCNLVSEMSQTVQFIYITHNKIAMEMASHLTGVTMAEPGVSRMVAVDVEEAVTLAQA